MNKQEDILTRKLSEEDKEVLLRELFGFSIIEGDVVDGEGYDFFAFDENLDYNFDTLDGVFEHYSVTQRKEGRYQLKSELKKLLE